MTKLTKFMVVHNDPVIGWDNVERNWRKLANVEKATWERTYFNKEKGMRYCLWLASSKQELKHIFEDLGISLESIIAVEETVPDLWGRRKWEEHLDAESAADTLAF